MFNIFKFLQLKKIKSLYIKIVKTFHRRWNVKYKNVDYHTGVCERTIAFYDTRLYKAVKV